MNKPQSLLCAALLGGALALTGCVTQPTQSEVLAANASAAAANASAAAAHAGAAASAAGSTAASFASATGAVLGNVLQAHGGASGLMSSLSVPASGTASNAAGVLTYCANNSGLSADKANQLAQQLLTSLGLPTPTKAKQDEGYVQGIAGMIIAPNGTLYSLDQIKGNVKDKACEFVMNSAANFLPQ